MSAVAQFALTALHLMREHRSLPRLLPLSSQSLHRVRNTSLPEMCYSISDILNHLCWDFVSTDAVDTSLLSDLSADLLGLEVESWSLAVSPDFCKQHDRRTVKRQDVIYGEPSKCNIILLYVFV